MAKLIPLFSGSGGNCTYIGGAFGGVLVDAGRSARAVLSALKTNEIDPRAIRAVFITHEHHDHISALRVLSGELNVPVYASAGTARALYAEMPQTEVNVIENCIELDGCRVTRFDTPHDCSGSGGYRIELDDGIKFAVCTDLGRVTDGVRNAITGCDVVLIESNHDVTMLKNGPYSIDLKLRILSDTGHLSNAACSAELPGLVECGATRIVLGHLSRENNTPQLALTSARAALLDCGMRENTDYILTAAAPQDNRAVYISR